MIRKGVTVTEVIVVVIILLVLLGVGLAFLRKMRAAANQAQCANNLRIIGEGVYNFGGGLPREFLEHAGWNVPLPAARIADGYATWAVLLAPYVAGSSALKDWDQRKLYSAQAAEIREAVVPLYFCPARTRSSFLSTKGDGPEGDIPGALGDYACASADGDAKFPFESAKANGAIILGEVLQRKDDLILRWQSRTDFASLERGLSNTILIGDKHVPLGNYGQATFGDGSLYNGGQPATSSRIGGPGFGLAKSPADPFNKNFGSSHPGVCMFLMADDSVRPTANNISEQILGQLIRREEP